MTMADCKRPPPGWRCTRGEHPDGPCAAVPNGEPTSKEQYDERTARNVEVVGFGFDVATVFPCPFCAAKGWKTVKVMDMEKAFAEPTKCGACERSCHVQMAKTAFSTSMRFVQTDGPDPAPWVPILRETDDERAARTAVTS